MKSTLAALALVVTSVCTTAFAATPESPVAHESRAELIAKLDAMGYETKGVDRHDTTYRMQIVDRQTGGIVQAVFDASSGELLEARLEEETVLGH
jgi:hypothetical protein